MLGLIILAVLPVVPRVFREIMSIPTKRFAL